jgi:hypothetical protein
MQITPYISDNYDFLKALARTKSNNKRNKILQKATTIQILSLVEICFNILKARFRLSARQRRRMMPHADFIRRMGRVRTERGAKKIVQIGGGIPTFFPALLTPIILEISKYLLERKNDGK